MNDTALEALHVAAKVIRRMPNVKSTIADIDGDSCEIVFTLKSGEVYILRLDEFDD